MRAHRMQRRAWWLLAGLGLALSAHGASAGAAVAETTDCRGGAVKIWATGPQTVDLGALGPGTWVLTPSSSDPVHPDADDQQNEIWTLEVGGRSVWTSPDLPSEVVSTSWSPVTVEVQATAALVARWAGAGLPSPGSVVPSVCVVAVPPPTTVSSSTPASEAPPLPASEAPVPPTSEAPPPPTTPVPSTTGAVLGTVHAAPPAVSAAGEVPRELAFTGSPQTWSMLVVGSALTVLGLVMVALEHRIPR